MKWGTLLYNIISYTDGYSLESIDLCDRLLQLWSSSYNVVRPLSFLLFLERLESQGQEMLYNRWYMLGLQASQAVSKDQFDLLLSWVLMVCVKLLSWVRAAQVSWTWATRVSYCLVWWVVDSQFSPIIRLINFKNLKFYAYSIKFYSFILNQRG